MNNILIHNAVFNRALILAIRQHEGQEDKAGFAYITHPIRVMMDTHLAEEFSGVKHTEARSIAVLHDVIEDTNMTEAELADALGPVSAREEEIALAKRIARKVAILSKRDDEKGIDGYMRFIERVQNSSRIAVAVKKADIRDNSDPSRLEHLDAKKRDYLVKKYDKAKRLLGMV